MSDPTLSDLGAALRDLFADWQDQSAAWLALAAPDFAAQAADGELARLETLALALDSQIADLCAVDRWLTSGWPAAGPHPASSAGNGTAPSASPSAASADWASQPRAAVSPPPLGVGGAAASGGLSPIVPAAVALESPPSTLQAAASRAALPPVPPRQPAASPPPAGTRRRILPAAKPHPALNASSLAPTNHGHSPPPEPNPALNGHAPPSANAPAAPGIKGLADLAHWINDQPGAQLSPHLADAPPFVAPRLPAPASPQPAVGSPATPLLSPPEPRQATLAAAASPPPILAELPDRLFTSAGLPLLAPKPAPAATEAEAAWPDAALATAAGRDWLPSVPQPPAQPLGWADVPAEIHARQLGGAVLQTPPLPSQPVPAAEPSGRAELAWQRPDVRPAAEPIDIDALFAALTQALRREYRRVYGDEEPR